MRLSLTSFLLLWPEIDKVTLGHIQWTTLEWKLKHCMAWYLTTETLYLQKKCQYSKYPKNVCFVLQFYCPVNPTGSCQAWSVYLTTLLLDRLSPLSCLPVLWTFFCQKHFEHKSFWQKSICKQCRPSSDCSWSILRNNFCVEVLRPSQPNGVMSSAVSLPNHTFTGQA